MIITRINLKNLSFVFIGLTKTTRREQSSITGRLRIRKKRRKKEPNTHNSIH